MTFKDELAIDQACYFNLDEFAETVVYFDGTNSSSIVAVVSYESAGPGFDADHAVIQVKKSDVPDPRYKDPNTRKRQTFTIDGVTWYLTSDKNKGLSLGATGLTWTIKINKNERATQWRQ